MAAVLRPPGPRPALRRPLAVMSVAVLLAAGVTATPGGATAAPAPADPAAPAPADPAAPAPADPAARGHRPAPRQMEHLNRGLVAVAVPDGVYLSWRFLGDEPDGTAYRLYRDGRPVATVADRTNLTDPDGTAASRYAVAAVVGGAERRRSPAVTPLAEQFIDLRLARPEPAVTPLLDVPATTITGRQFEPVDMDLLRRVRDAHADPAGRTEAEFDALIAPFRTHFNDPDWAPEHPFATPDTALGNGRFRISEPLFRELDAAFTRYVDELDRGPRLPYLRNADGTLASATVPYTPGDASVGDLDGDGDYELVLKWDPADLKDSSQYGITSPAIIDAYDFDTRSGAARLRWRINVGYNIRSGPHDTQLVVYDFTGDGRAELIIKTADGTTTGTLDAQGRYVVRDVIGRQGATFDNIQRYLREGDTAALDRFHDGLNTYTVGWVLPGGNTPPEQNVRQWGKIYTYGPIGTSNEYLTAFDGRTGRVIDTVDYAFPYGAPNWGAAPVDHRGASFSGQVDPYWEDPATRWGFYPWGDHQGNRANRFLAGVAYLDGVHPSAIMARGYYMRTTLAAYTLRGDRLVLQKEFDSAALPADERFLAEERGVHWMSVADVDADRRDEIVYGTLVLDDDLTMLTVPGTWFPFPEPPANVDLTAQMRAPDADDRFVHLSHGDALHVTDLIPTRPGLEVFVPVEAAQTTGTFDREGNRGPGFRPGAAVYDPATGEVLNGFYGGRDIGRGVAANIDPNNPGAEYWASVPGSPTSFVYSAATGERLYSAAWPINFLVWWDGDLTRELLDSNRISKADTDYTTRPTTVGRTDLVVATGATSINGTKSTPVISADLFGDWREEVVWRLGDDAVRLFTTTVPTSHKIRTLMHDPQYRVQVAGQNTTYNQPPHPSFYLDPAHPLPARRTDIDVSSKVR